MPPAVPLIAAAAGSAVAGIGTFGFATAAFGVLPWSIAATAINAGVGLLVSTAISQVAGNAFGKKSRSSGNTSFSQQAQGITTMVRSSVESHKIIYGEARVSGPVNYPKTTNSGLDSDGQSVNGSNIFFHVTIPLAGHEIDSVTKVFLDDNELTIDANNWVTSEPYYKDGKSYVRVKVHTGSADQVADPDLVSELGVDSNFRGRGIAYLYVRLQWNPDVFTTGIPNISAVVKGKKVFDPRTNTVAWSDNPALCIRDYMSESYGFGCDDDEINNDYFITAANACEEQVYLSTAEYQNRYTCNGVVDTANGPLDNLSDMLTSLVGTVTYVQGKFRLYAGVYTAPVGEITMDDIIGDTEYLLRTPKQDLFNAVQGTYVDPEKDYQVTDFPSIKNSTYEAQDGGERLFTDVELPFTNHVEMAQRIGKITLEKGRQGIVIQLPCTDALLENTVFDNIEVTDAQVGWDAKEFKILKWSYSMTEGIHLTLQEEASASYDWNNGEATQADPAPDTNLPNPFVVVVPTGVAFNSRSVETTGGDALYILSLTWDEHPDAFVKMGGKFELQYKLSTESTYNQSFLVDGELTESEILTSSVNIAYDLRIRAVNTLGFKSNWVTINNAIVGSSGGVGATQDWGEWVSAPSATQDWGDWVSSPSVTSDWEYFT